MALNTITLTPKPDNKYSWGTCTNLGKIVRLALMTNIKIYITKLQDSLSLIKPQFKQWYIEFVNLTWIDNIIIIIIMCLLAKHINAIAVTWIIQSENSMT